MMGEVRGRRSGRMIMLVKKKKTRRLQKACWFITRQPAFSDSINQSAKRVAYEKD